MRAIEQRGASMAREVQKQRIERIAGVLRTVFPGAAIEVSADDVAVAARGIGRQRLDDPDLRFLTETTR